jgi:hypothetical protein
VNRVRTPSSPVREREREREKRKKREGEKDRDRRDVEYVFQFIELLFLFLKVITGTLAPFTYLVFYKTVECSSNTQAYYTSM